MLSSEMESVNKEITVTNWHTWRLDMERWDNEQISILKVEEEMEGKNLEDTSVSLGAPPWEDLATVLPEYFHLHLL